MRLLYAAGLAFAVLACAAVAPGQDAERLTPGISPILPASHLEDDAPGRPSPASSDANVDQLFLDQLNGLVVTLNDIPPMSRARSVVMGVNIQGNAQLREALSKFVGKPLFASTFPAVAETIVAHFERYDRPVVDVSFPEQDITDGILRVDVAEGRFGALEITGGAHWNVERLRQELELPETVSQAAILTELDWMNESRLRKASVSVSEGPEGGTNVEFQLSDERTWRGFTGYENSGVDLLGEHRFFIGIEAGNVLNRGHQAIYQYYTDDSLERFQAHALSYRIPIDRLRHLVSLTAAVVESDVELDGAGGLRRSNGSSWLAAVSYEVPLKRSQNLKHSLALGIEYKSSNNDFEFGGGESLDTPTEVIQAGVSYDAEIRNSSGITVLDLDLKWSPGGTSERNSDAAFAQIRPGAESDYLVASAEIERSVTLGRGFELNFGAKGQWSNGTALIPSEQLALGGYDGIRGYEERETFGDTGFILSVETYSPVLKTNLAGIRGLIFVDYGIAYDEIESESDELASYGAGLRFQISERAALRFDYGRQFETGEGRGHIGVVVEF